MSERPDQRALPSNVDAERTALGAVLVDNRAFHDIAETLRASDFYRDAHRRIFEAMATLYELSMPVDLVTLRAELARTQSLELAGGVAYVAGLVEGVPRLENVVPWCRLIKDASVLRQLAAAGSRITQMAMAADDAVPMILDRAEHEVFSLADQGIRGGLESVPSLAREAFQRLEAEARGEVTGAPTGFIGIDRMTGGLIAPDLTILAARPGMGKTAFALQIARNVSRAGPVAVFSLEMSKAQLMKRYMFTEARVDSSKTRTQGGLDERDWQRLTESWSTFNSLAVFIDDTSALTPLELMAKCRRLKARLGLALVVVDYLQLMTVGREVGSRQEEISAISQSLKALAKDLSVPVLAMSQLNRAVEGRADRQPQLSDLRESGAIEQDADNVLFIHRPEVGNPKPENRGLARILIEKQRSGPVGVVELAFVPEYTRFENLALPMTLMREPGEDDE